VILLLDDQFQHAALIMKYFAAEFMTLKNTYTAYLFVKLPIDGERSPA